MAKDKNSFVLYTDLINTISKLPDEQAGKLFKIILEYVNDKNPDVDDVLLQVAFEPIKLSLKRDLVKWRKKKKKNSENGKKGGIKSGESRRTKRTLHFASKNEANEAVSVTVSDSVTVRENTGPPSNLENSNLFRKPVIPTKNQVWEAISSAGGTKEMAKSFYEKHEGTGWFINGSPIVNYQALAQRFVANWKQNEKKEDLPVQPSPNYKKI